MSRPSAWTYDVRRLGPVAADVIIAPKAEPSRWTAYRVAWADGRLSVRPAADRAAIRTTALQRRYFGEGVAPYKAAEAAVRRRERHIREAVQ